MASTSRVSALAAGATGAALFTGATFVSAPSSTPKLRANSAVASSASKPLAQVPLKTKASAPIGAVAISAAPADLKPGNFLLINGRLKVIDFGIAKRISNDTTNIQRDASVGTLSYMAPEAVKQGQLKLGRASDIWSLGIILYQMVYGHPPLDPLGPCLVAMDGYCFQGQAHLEPMQRLLRLNDPSLRIEFPAHRFSLGGQALVEVLGSCLQRDPRRRPSLCELLSHPFLEAPNSGRIPLQERPQEKQVMVPEPEKVARSSTLSLEEMLQRSKSKLSARHPRLDLPVVPEEKENLLRPPKAS